MGGDCTDYYGLFCSSKKSEQQKKKTNDTNWIWQDGGDEKEENEDQWIMFLFLNKTMN